MGETKTGNTTMLLEEGLDTGPILLQQSLPLFIFRMSGLKRDIIVRRIRKAQREGTW
jgi:methionyl-tRNA formyltransferase